MDPKIYEKVAAWCVLRERSELELKQKLFVLKIDKGEYAIYLAKLKDENFLNEERFIKAYVDAHVRKKWGKNKIKMGLYSKGIKGSLITQYLENIDDEDYGGEMEKLAQRKWANLYRVPEKERRIKVLRFLLGKGYEQGRIKTALGKLK